MLCYVELRYVINSSCWSLFDIDYEYAMTLLVNVTQHGTSFFVNLFPYSTNFLIVSSYAALHYCAASDGSALRFTMMRPKESSCFTTYCRRRELLLVRKAFLGPADVKLHCCTTRNSWVHFETCCTSNSCSRLISCSLSERNKCWKHTCTFMQRRHRCCSFHFSRCRLRSCLLFDLGWIGLPLPPIISSPIFILG